MMTTIKKLLMLVALAAIALPSLAQRTPTMGWSSWNTYALDINKTFIRQQADAVQQSGLQEAGHRYITIDVDLNKGDNTIRLWNDAAWLPDIDGMELE